MNTRMMYAGAGLTFLLSCSHKEEQQPTVHYEDILRLERKLDLLLQQEETEEHIFLRNVKLLRDYVSTHSEQYDFQNTNSNITDVLSHSDYLPLTAVPYANLKSWSKRTLDGFSSLFIDAPGAR